MSSTPRRHKERHYREILTPDVSALEGFSSHGQHWQRQGQPRDDRGRRQSSTASRYATLQAAASPQVLYPPAASHVGAYDCDCACDLALPTVLAMPSAADSYDCDCACALSVATAPDVRVQRAVWQKQARAVPYHIRNGWQAYFNPDGPVGVSVLDAEAQRVLAAFEAPASPEEVLDLLPGLSASLIETTIQDLAQVGLLHPTSALSAMAFPSLARPTNLSAWLHITEACNLRCPYCYVRKRPNDMSEAVGRQAVDRLVETAQRYGYRGLKVKYAGGEPTLRFPTIQVIHDYAASQTARLGLELEEVILSNGVEVTDEMLAFMSQAGMGLMISLDGGPEIQDWLRARWDGAHTYKAVTRTVERALTYGLEPRISITLTALNLEGSPQAVAFALERELPFNLNFYRECMDTDLSGAAILMPDPPRLVETMRDIFDLIEAHPTYPRPLTGILDRTRLDVPHDRPCSAGRDYLVVDSQGQVSACQMLLEEPWTDLDDEDPLATLRQRGEGLFVPVDDLPNCRDCQWRTVCAGGCPLMRKTALHSGYCRVYKVALPELVRLEASRLIATHSTPSTHPQ